MSGRFQAVHEEARLAQMPERYEYVTDDGKTLWSVRRAPVFFAGGKRLVAIDWFWFTTLVVLWLTAMLILLADFIRAVL